MSTWDEEVGSWDTWTEDCWDFVYVSFSAAMTMAAGTAAACSVPASLSAGIVASMSTSRTAQARPSLSVAVLLSDGFVPAASTSHAMVAAMTLDDSVSLAFTANPRLNFTIAATFTLLDGPWHAQGGAPSSAWSTSSPVSSAWSTRSGLPSNWS